MVYSHKIFGAGGTLEEEHRDPHFICFRRVESILYSHRVETETIVSFPHFKFRNFYFS